MLLGLVPCGLVPCGLVPCGLVPCGLGSKRPYDVDPSIIGRQQKK